MKQKSLLLNKTYTIWGVVLIIWALYRAFVVLPEVIDELFVKPLIFLGPVLFFVYSREKRTLASLGIIKGKWKRDIYLGICFGSVFIILAILASFIKFGKISLSGDISVTGISFFTVLILSLATSVSEELFVRGFLFTRLKEGYRDEFKAMIVSSLMYLLILVPVIFTRLHLTGTSLLVFVAVNIVLSFANTMILSETKTITLPILIHAFWNTTVALYL